MMPLSPSGAVEIRVTYTGPDEKEYELTATSMDAKLEHDSSYENVSSYYGDSVIPVLTSDRTILTAVLDEPYVITVKEKPQYEVVRTARVRIDDMTLEHSEQAREALGVPKDAQFSINNFYLMEGVAYDVGTPRPVEIEFKWKQKV